MTTRRAFIRKVGLSGIGLGIGLSLRTPRPHPSIAELARAARFNEPIVGVEFGTSKFCAAVSKQMVDGTIKILGIAEANYRVENQTPKLTPVLYHLCTALKAVEEASDVIIRKVHLAVLGPKSIAKSNIALLGMLGVEAGDVAFPVIPCATAVLSSEEKHHGALMIDLGALQTGHIAYSNGEIKDCGSHSRGGFHVTQDLASHLRIPWARAESLKIENGHAFPGRSAHAEAFQKVIHLRLRAILEKTKKRLISNGVRLREMRTGIHLTGGGSGQRGIVQLASEVFGLPACIAGAKGFAWNDGIVEHPQHSCAIGLLKLCASGVEDIPRRRYFGLVPQ